MIFSSPVTGHNVLAYQCIFPCIYLEVNCNDWIFNLQKEQQTHLPLIYNTQKYEDNFTSTQSRPLLPFIL